jgi:hypothetical protein
VIRWKVLLHEFLKLGDAGFQFLPVLKTGAGLLVQVPRPGDVGVLQCIGPGAELAGARFSQFDQI